MTPVSIRSPKEGRRGQGGDRTVLYVSITTAFYYDEGYYPLTEDDDDDDDDDDLNTDKMMSFRPSSLSLLFCCR